MAAMGRPRGFTEHDVVSAARELFWQNGYAGSSLEDLTAVTGLGRASLYAAFGDKHSLFVAALDSYCEAAHRRIVDDLHGVSTAYEGLVNHVRRVGHDNLVDTKRRGCLLAKAAAELVPTDAVVAKRVKRAFELYRRELVASIVEAQRDGDLDPAADPDAVAALVLTVLRGLEAMRKLGATRATLTAATEQFVASLPRTTSAR
jgi:TetR/AcrR family transcriptional repressor of nem operon